MKLYGTMEINENGVLHIGGKSSIELREEFGTPLLVLDEEKIRSNLNKYIDTLEQHYHNFSVAYAAKAFMNRTLARIIEEEGGGLDVVSGGELQMALAAGFSPDKIFYHGNNKSVEEIKMGLENNVGRFMIDNIKEAERINRLAGKRNQTVEAILRVIPGIEAHTHEYIMTGHIDSKFGIELAGNRALEVIKKLNKMPALDLKGIHAHIGSQIFEVEPYQRLIEILMEFLKELQEKTGISLEELDLGGGFGIAHLEDEEEPDLSQFIETIAEKVKKESKSHGLPRPRLILEPGRSIIGTAGTTIYSIGTIKQVPEMSKYLIVDGGMTDNIRPALYDADYDAFLANRAYDKNMEEVTVAGKCCESGDILVENIMMPEAEVSDMLAIPATGAYTYAMSSNYNGLPRPAVVLVNRGQANIIIKRESYTDLYSNDVIPEGY